MKKILFGLVMGFVLTFGINVNAAEINAQLVKIFDSSKGGIIQTFNQNSALNVKLGSEGDNGGNIGGTLILYNNGNKRITAGTVKDKDAGNINLLDSRNNIGASIKADDSNYGSMIFFNNSKGEMSTYLTSNFGYINNQKIITEDYLKQNYINKSDVQKMVDDAVQKALSK